MLSSKINDFTRIQPRDHENNSLPQRLSTREIIKFWQTSITSSIFFPGVALNARIRKN